MPDGAAISKDVYLAKPFTKKRFYTKADVAQHSRGTADTWVSLFHKVYDLTELLADNQTSELAVPLLEAAGTDITHWFDPDTRDPKTYVDPDTNTKEVYCPQGRFLHVPPKGPESFDASVITPWWQDSAKYCIGDLSKKTVKINVQNTLTKHCATMEVPSEETLTEIQDRYQHTTNYHVGSYTWKRLGKVLEMDRTLSENGLVDDSEEMLRLGMDPDDHVATLHIYFNDDLTEA